MKRSRSFSVMACCLLAISSVHAQAKKIIAAEAKDAEIVANGREQIEIQK